MDDLIRSGRAIIGTPDDCVDTLRALRAGLGPFGGVLIPAQEWASPEAVRRSCALFARQVKPALLDLLGGTWAPAGEQVPTR